MNMRIIFFLLFFLSLDAVSSDTLSSEDKLQRIYFRLAGKSLSLRHPERQVWLNLTTEGKIFEVAQEIIRESSFIDRVSYRWGSFFLTSEKTNQVSLNDALATVVGIIRDDRDARDLLTGDFVYGPTQRLGGGQPSLRTNEVFRSFEERLLSMMTYLQVYSPQWNVASMLESAGLLSSRWWGETYYQGGTNRRSVVGLMDTFLCTPIESWKTLGLPTRRIRQDIPRDPSGDPRIFQQDCRSCHAPMDGLAGAFANLDFVNDTLIYRRHVSPKYLNNDHTYPEGFKTVDNSWVNYLSERKDLNIGWAPMTKGNGIRELGQMVVESEGFSRCIVKRSVSFFCGKKLMMNDPWVLQLAKNFKEADEYQLKKLFMRIATSNNCN